MGQNVIRMALHFLNGNGKLENINKTNIVLIPKVKKQTKITKFRPISLCNVTYKVIAKTMTSKMQRVMPQIIDEAQSAFVKGSQITDNVIVAFEAFHWLQHLQEKQEKRLALKLDISKAYDRVEWDFLEQIM